MENSLAKTERTYLRIIVGGGLGILLVVFFGCLTYKVYQRWEVRHLLRLSAAYMAGGDLRTASLSTRRALQINPANIDALRMMASIAEQAGDLGELEWRRKVKELGANSDQDNLALGNAALRSHDFPTAEQTLKQLSPGEKQSAEYESAIGRLAEMKDNHLEAEAHWQKAVELAPTDSAYQMQLASLRITMQDPIKVAAARATLERLRADPRHRATATRTLIVDGASHGMGTTKLRGLANELQGYPEATFADHLLYLDLLRQLHDPEFSNYLLRQETRAKGNEFDLASLISWMNNNQQSETAIQFSSGLSPASLTAWPVPSAVADSYAKLKDWSGLERFVKGGSWSAYDFLRHAYLARALREQDKRGASDQEWSEAQKQISNQPQAILALARLAAAWGWRDESVALLWNLSNLAEARSVALRELYLHYAAAGDTAGLYRVLQRSLENSPDDRALQNNFAQISLLLDVDSNRAQKLAVDLNKKEPNNPAYISTYAFSRYIAGDIKGALAAMSRLSAAQQRDPAIAAYYGIILAAAEEKEKAREFLKLGEAAKLLPEEKALVAKAANAVK